MKRMNILDAAWLAVESGDSPMHVANLQIFSLPKNAPRNYLLKLVQRMRSESAVVAPWLLRLQYPGRLGRIVMPAWQADPGLDLDYHVRHSALPKPGGERELGVLISRLHSIPLDFHRPLWECHIIEGLRGRRFAMYTKIHHSLIDGVSGVRLMQRILSPDPEKSDMPAPWCVGLQDRSQTVANAQEPSVPAAVGHLLDTMQARVSTVPKLIQAFAKMAAQARLDDEEGGMALPFAGPSSLINGRVSGQRRFATQQFTLSHLRKLARAAGCSLNDLVLFLCGTALRRYLLEQNALPESSLTAGIPVNVRPAGDDETGTAISFIIASLATCEGDPGARLAAIRESTQIAKAHLQSLPRKALNQYTLLLMSPYMLQLLSGMGGQMRPVFNVTISNVPGPESELYFEGSKLEAMYPVSLVAHGGALNITCLSYAGKLNFGFTACRESIPSMQKIAVYTGEALGELEALLQPVLTGRRTHLPKTRRRPPARPRGVPTQSPEEAGAARPGRKRTLDAKPDAAE